MHACSMHCLVRFGSLCRYVYSTPQILAMKKPCPQYEHEKQKYLNSELVQEFLSKYRPLFQYVSEHVGEPINSCTDLEFVYNTLFIEELNNLTLPAWTQPIYPEPMRTVAAFSFSVSAATLPLKRLKGGTFVIIGLPCVSL